MLLNCLICVFINWNFNTMIACSRRSDSGARAKNKASERAGKKTGETGGEDFDFTIGSV